MNKVLLIGDCNVGKTAFVHRLVNNIFSEKYQATLGVDFASKTVELDGGKRVKIQLWDIAGSERTMSMTRVYYKGAAACILMFDLTQRDTFVNCGKWKMDLDAKVFLPDGTHIPCLLLANKSDLTAMRVVSEQEIKSFASVNNCIGWCVCSVKENKGLDEGIRILTTEMMERTNAMPVSSDESEFLLEPVKKQSDCCK